MEPWQKREGEQQRFVEKLADTIREAAEDSGNYTVFMIDFPFRCSGLSSSLRAKRRSMWIGKPSFSGMLSSRKSPISHSLSQK